MTTDSRLSGPTAAIPGSFLEYVQSMGPGLIVVLTWLGAGDIVQSAAAGGSYGYALMWSFAACLTVRYLFVSIIAKYQLCNQHSESVLSGLSRLHPLVAPCLFVCSLFFGHAAGVVLLIGAAEASMKLSNLGSVRLWGVVLSILAFLIAFRPFYRTIEKVFFLFLGAMTISLVGLAVWANPNPMDIAKGVFGLAVPATRGRFTALWIIVAMVGAVGGGIANLMYPYFFQAKGWTTPAHRRVQHYDLMLGIIVLMLLDLSVWIVGAEILHPKKISVVDLASLARILGESLGQFGTTLFYLGIFAALYSSIIGNSLAYSLLGADAYRHWRGTRSMAQSSDGRKDRVYYWAVIWIIFSPLVWVLIGHSDFVGLTFSVNVLQVIVLPVLVVGIWIITANRKYIGVNYRNRWWENVSMAFILILACVGVFFAISSVPGV